MSDTPAQTPAATGPKPKKSVALSGVPAGNTALCTVGRTGNDLHYRGYDILDIADVCEFEEVAHLLIHGHFPNREELKAYKTSASEPAQPAHGGEERAGAAARRHPSHGRHAHRRLHPGLRAAGARRSSPSWGARHIADRLIASLGSALLYWYHFSHNGKRIECETDDDSIGGHFLHLLHGKPAPEIWVRAMHTSLILYAEHEFNASTFAGRVIAGTGSDMYSAITGAIGALRGPKHGGANEVAFGIQSRYDTPDEAEADIRARVLEKKEVIIGFGHPVYTIADPRNKVIKAVAKRLADDTTATTSSTTWPTGWKR
jgi:2-methylcitrate synthase